MRYVFSTRQADTKRYRFPTHINDLVLDRADAATSEVFIVVLNEGEAPPPHQHDDTEQIFYVLAGRGRLMIGSREHHDLEPDDVVRIPPSTLHSVEAVGGALRYLAIDCFVNGRPDAEPTWERHVEMMCSENGWDLKRVLAEANQNKG